MDYEISHGKGGAGRCIFLSGGDDRVRSPGGVAAGDLERCGIARVACDGDRFTRAAGLLRRPDGVGGYQKPAVSGAFRIPGSVRVLLLFHDSYYGLLDEDGKVILPCEYDEDSIDIDPPGLITASKRGKYGIFDLEGNPIVKCSYVDGCGIQNDSVISAETSKDVTLFNIRGQVIVGKGQYVRIHADKDGLIYAEDKERTAHYIDLWGNHR